MRLIDNGRGAIHLPSHDRYGPDRATTNPLRQPSAALRARAAAADPAPEPPGAGFLHRETRGAVMSDSIFTLRKSPGGARYEIDTAKARLDRALLPRFRARPPLATDLP